ncbi:MAG: carboxypeptidase-like regulatory domain-containing protein [Terriglobia bacterium]
MQSVRVDGREMIDTPIEIKGSSPLEGVEIVISPQGASLNGNVKSEEQGPPVKGATVVIFPVDLEKRGPSSRFVKTSQSDQQGRYSIQGLPPAEYFICGLKSLEGGLESDEDFLKELQKTSTQVRLELGESRDEPLIAQEAPEFE